MNLHQHSLGVWTPRISRQGRQMVYWAIEYLHTRIACIEYTSSFEDLLIKCFSKVSFLNHRYWFWWVLKSWRVGTFTKIVIKDAVALENSVYHKVFHTSSSLFHIRPIPWHNFQESYILYLSWGIPWYWYHFLQQSDCDVSLTRRMVIELITSLIGSIEVHKVV